MKLKTLQLRNFRNHTDTHIESAENANVFLGNNGEGKTNVIEALSYLCLTKSFYAANDLTTLKLGESAFKISGEVHSDRDISFSVEVTYESIETDKKYWLNKSQIQKLSSIIGKFPIVILSPEYSGITFGSPSDRRKFIDLAISQSSRSYFEDILEYRRILKQRNRILFDGRRSGGEIETVLDPWTESIIEFGARLTKKRSEFINSFTPYLISAYQEIGVRDEIPNLNYQSFCESEKIDTLPGLKEHFAKYLHEHAQEEQRLGSTIVGPHRDEIELQLNQKDLRKYGSQGQHKTFLIALKVAEFHYLLDTCGETPILILDDVFSELDMHRSRRLLEYVSKLGQYFITTTDERIFPDSFFQKAENKKFYISRGKILHENAAA